LGIIIKKQADFGANFGICKVCSIFLISNNLNPARDRGARGKERGKEREVG
jgi:hypothetical protein